MIVWVLYLTRALGAPGFGVVAFAFSFLTFGIMIVDFGFDQLGQREVTRETFNLRDLVETVVAVRFIIAVVTFAAIVTVVLLNDINARAKPLIILYTVSLLTYAIDLNWVFFGKEKMHYPAFAEIIIQVVYVGVVIGFVKSVDQMVYIPLGFLAGRLVAVVYQYIYYLRFFGPFIPRLRWKIFTQLVPEAMPLWGSMIIVQVMNNFSILALGVWASMNDAGIFAAVQRVMRAPMFMALAYFTVIRPSINRAHRDGFESVRIFLRKSLRLSMGFAVGLAVGGWMTAEPLVLFLFGEDFLGGVLALRFLVLGTSLFIVNRHYRFLMIAFGHQSTDFKMMVAAAAVNAALTVALIKPFGATGAAAAVLGGEILITSVGYLLVLSLIAHVPMGRFILKPVLCSIAMAGTLTLCTQFNVIVQIVIGGGVYCVAMVALGVVRVHEVKVALGGFLPNKSAARQGT